MQCFECGKYAEHNHHVVPRSKSGTKTIPLCVDCHAKVHDVKTMTKPYLVKLALMKKTNAECAFIFWQLMAYEKSIEQIDIEYRELIPTAGIHFARSQVERMMRLNPRELLVTLNSILQLDKDQLNHYVLEWIDYIDANKKD